MKIGFIFGILVAALCALPSVSDARPGDPIADCHRHGSADCSRPECAQFCLGNHRGPKAPDPRHGKHHVRPAPAPGPAVVTRPLPPPAPGPVVVTRPLPPPVPGPVVVIEKRRPLYEINRDISRLRSENDRLAEQLEKERFRAENAYDFCRRSLPVYVADRCIYDDAAIRSIQADIDDNQLKIRYLEDEKRLR